MIQILIVALTIASSALALPEKPDCSGLVAQFSGGSARLRRLIDRQSRLTQSAQLKGIYGEIRRDIIRLRDKGSLGLFGVDAEVSVGMGVSRDGSHLTVDIGIIKVRGVEYGKKADGTNHAFLKFISAVVEGVGEKLEREPGSLTKITVRACDVINPGLHEILPTLGFTQLPLDPLLAAHPIIGFENAEVHSYELVFTKKEAPTQAQY